jgi:hypothetical protein
MFLTLSEAHVTYLWGQWAQQDKQFLKSRKHGFFALSGMVRQIIRNHLSQSLHPPMKKKVANRTEG